MFPKNKKTGRTQNRTRESQTSFVQDGMLLHLVLVFLCQSCKRGNFLNPNHTTVHVHVVHVHVVVTSETTNSKSENNSTRRKKNEK